MIYVFGGINGSDSYSKKTYIYNISNNSWSAGADMPDYGKSSGWAEWLNSTHIILFGGTGSGSYSWGKHTYIYDTENDSWSDPGSSAYLYEWGLSGANINGIVYTFGGVVGSSSTSKDIYYYNTSTSSWVDTGRDSYYYHCYDDCVELEGSAICIGSGGYGYGGVIQNYLFYPRKPELYIGSTTDLFWAYSGYDFTGTEELSGFESNISTYLDSCEADRYGYCRVPVRCVSKSVGGLRLENLSVCYNYTNNATIDINATAIQDYLDAQSSSGYYNIPIKISSETNSTIQVDNINITYYGSDNITVTAHFDGNADYNASNDTQIVKVVYSNFNVSLPPDYPSDELVWLPVSNSSKNVTPWGQTDSIPGWNITSLAYDQPFNLSIKVNESYPSCMNMTVSSSNNKSEGILLNTSYQQIITNFTPLTSQGIWWWLDLENCDRDSLGAWVRRTYYLKACCYDCVKCE